MIYINGDKWLDHARTQLSCHKQEANICILFLTRVRRKRWKNKIIKMTCCIIFLWIHEQASIHAAWGTVNKQRKLKSSLMNQWLHRDCLHRALWGLSHRTGGIKAAASVKSPSEHKQWVPRAHPGCLHSIEIASQKESLPQQLLLLAEPWERALWVLQFSELPRLDKFHEISGLGLVDFVSSLCPTSLSPIGRKWLHDMIINTDSPKMLGVPYNYKMNYV